MSAFQNWTVYKIFTPRKQAYYYLLLSSLLSQRVSLLLGSLLLVLLGSLLLILTIET